MTRKVAKSPLQLGSSPTDTSKVHLCRDFTDTSALKQNIELDQRYAAGSRAMWTKAIPITRKIQTEQQNRRPDGPAVASVLALRAKELRTWAVRCLSTRHTAKKPGLSFFAVTG